MWSACFAVGKSQGWMNPKEDMEYDRKLNALLGDNALGTFGETKVQKPHRLEVVRKIINKGFVNKALDFFRL
jgi:hypothetical protein